MRLDEKIIEVTLIRPKIKAQLDAITNKLTKAKDYLTKIRPEVKNTNNITYPFKLEKILKADMIDLYKNNQFNFSEKEKADKIRKEVQICLDTWKKESIKATRKMVEKVYKIEEIVDLSNYIREELEDKYPNYWHKISNIINLRLKDIKNAKEDEKELDNYTNVDNLLRRIRRNINVE